FIPADPAVHKRFEFLDPIEDSLNLHPVPFVLIDGCLTTLSSQSRGQDALPFTPPKTDLVAAYLLCYYPHIFLKSQILFALIRAHLQTKLTLPKG
ncbi:MAG: hypothetical protein PVI97_20220, partial [Candidatus Thiodiazotropha sp.]